MARFDVYANPGSHAKTTPCLLDVQSDLLGGLDSRMVIPPNAQPQAFSAGQAVDKTHTDTNGSGQRVFARDTQDGRCASTYFETRRGLTRRRTGTNHHSAGFPFPGALILGVCSASATA